jgi:hypothetical protein
VRCNGLIRAGLWHLADITPDAQKIDFQAQSRRGTRRALPALILSAWVRYEDRGPYRAESPWVLPALVTL